MVPMDLNRSGLVHGPIFTLWEKRAARAGLRAVCMTVSCKDVTVLWAGLHCVITLLGSAIVTSPIQFIEAKDRGGCLFFSSSSATSCLNSDRNDGDVEIELFKKAIKIKLGAVPTNSRYLLRHQIFNVIITTYYKLNEPSLTMDGF